jgi:hypothetical protein
MAASASSELECFVGGGGDVYGDSENAISNLYSVGAFFYHDKVLVPLTLNSESK